MVVLLNLLSTMWMAWCAVRSISRIGRRLETVDVVILLHFLFCGFPLLLDLLVGSPKYLSFPGFRLATQDPATCILYAMYVACCPVVWDKFGRAALPVACKNGSTQPRILSVIVRRYRYMLYFLLVSPILLLPLAPDLTIYEFYSIEEREFQAQPMEVLRFHAYLSISCLFSIVAASGLLSQSRRFKRAAAVTIPFVIAASWLVGKRYAVAVAIVLVGYAFLSRGNVRGLWVWIFGSASVIFFLFFSIYYQSSVRNINTIYKSDEEVYESMRIDFGRDDVIKATLFAELHPSEMKILDFRGQSLLIYTTLPIPRSLWPEKPISYGTNMACAVRFEPKGYLGWCMTTSILEEAIANFSWFGVVLGQLIVAWICRVGDATRDSFVGVFTLIISTLLCAVHLSAFMPLFLCWLGLVLVVRIGRTPPGFLRRVIHGITDERFPTASQIRTCGMKKTI